MIKPGIVVRALRYVGGEAEFSAIIPDSENTVNEIKGSIRVYNIYCKDGRIHGFISPGDYYTLCKVIRKNGGRVKVERKIGLPFVIKKYKRRKVFFIGGAVGIVLTAVLTMFVWNVSVSGGTEDIRSDLISVLPEYGIHVGAFKKGIDIKNVRNKLASDFPELSFVAVNLRGNEICVEIKLNEDKPPIDAPDTYGNIIAEKDGKIAYYRVYNGFRVIEEGDYVFKGQLLVSGIKEDYFGRELYFNSSAKVFASTENTLTIKIPKKTYLQKNGRTYKKRYISVFNVKIPLHFHIFPAKYCDTEEYTKNLTLFGKTVPVVYTEKKITKTTYTEKMLSEDELVLCAENILNEQFSATDKKVISYKYDISYDEDNCIMTVNYILLEDIAKYVPLYIENGE